MGALMATASTAAATPVATVAAGDDSIRQREQKNWKTNYLFTFVQSQGEHNDANSFRAIYIYKIHFPCVSRAHWDRMAI